MTRNPYPARRHHRFVSITKALLTPVCTLLILGGCTHLAPHYARPAAPVPEALDNAATTSSTTAVYAPLSWDAVVQSEQLRDVIALSLQNNRDLRAAVLAIERAQAQ